VALVRSSRISPSRDSDSNELIDSREGTVPVPKAQIRALEKEHRALEALLAQHGLPQNHHPRSSSLVPTGTFRMDKHAEARQVAHDFMRARTADTAADPFLLSDEPVPTHRHQQQQQRIRELELEVARLDARAAAAERQALTAEQSVAQRDVELEQKSNEVRESHDKCRQLVRSLTDARDEAARLRADVAALQSTVDQLQRTGTARRHQTAAHGDELRALRRELEDSREAEAALREECDRLRDKVMRYQIFHEREQEERKAAEHSRAQGLQGQGTNRGTERGAPMPRGDGQRSLGAAAPAADGHDTPHIECAPPPPSRHLPEYVVHERGIGPQHTDGVYTVGGSDAKQTSTTFFTTGNYSAQDEAQAHASTIPAVRHLVVARAPRPTSDVTPPPSTSHAETTSVPPTTTDGEYVSEQGGVYEAATQQPQRETRRVPMPWPDFTPSRLQAEANRQQHHARRSTPSPHRDDWLPENRSPTRREAPARSGQPRRQLPVHYEGHNSIAWSRRADDL
jgi:predicted  nucleic acid-binding Zn-ribbon protein